MDRVNTAHNKRFATMLADGTKISICTTIS
jgi:hypothetical protein